MFKLCDDIDTMAMTLLDGELADQELRDMELHLLACPACKSHVERERAVHQLRRQRLAAPPAPALLRARIGRALDEVDRARRPSMRSYLLPVGAIVAAAAALVVFIATSRTPAREVDHAVGKPPHSATPEPLKVMAGGIGERGAWDESALQFQHSGTQFFNKSKDSALLYYAVLTPDGDQASITAIVMDAETMGLDPAAAKTVGGYPVWLGDSGLVLVRDGNRGIILSSRSFSQEQLVGIVGRSLLVMRVGDDDPRH